MSLRGAAEMKFRVAKTRKIAGSQIRRANSRQELLARYGRKYEQAVQRLAERGYNHLDGSAAGNLPDPGR
jgi:hypothetical protein